MSKPDQVVVIIGGGFAGLSAAKALRKTSVKVILIDRYNHHTFQPLLYQVATSELAPGLIGAPIREVARKWRNTTTILGDVSGIDITARCISLDKADGKRAQVDYDYLIVAGGVQSSYFGHDDFARFAPGLKSLADAAAIRNKILSALEQAEAEEDPTVQKELLTFVLVGAGPTGIEMASAISFMARNTLQGEYRRIDTGSVRVVVADRGDRPLANFSPQISEKVKKRLRSIGVELDLGHGVDSIDEGGVTIAGKRIASRTVIWTAGVSGSALAKQLGTDTDKAGRVLVKGDLTLPDHPEVMVVGDMAALNQDGKPLPGVAQVAIQQGRYAGSLIRRRVSGSPAPPAFRYFDKGNLAVVGKNYAVLERGKFHLTGYIAWTVWATVHLLYLGQANLKLGVLGQWMWTYLTGQRGSRLILRTAPNDNETPGLYDRPQP